jgi:hypothetical protein
MSQVDFRTNIMEERIRELFAENWRRIDLIPVPENSLSW